MKTEQDATLKQVYQACCRTGHELLLEVILPSDMDKMKNTMLKLLLISII